MSRKSRAEDAKLKAILDAAVDGILTIDEGGIIDSMNAAVQEMFGYEPDDIVGRNVSMLMPEPDRSAHDSYLRSYLDTGEAKIIGTGREVVGRRSDGTTFPMELAVSEFPVDGKRFFAGIVKDISRRRAVESEALRMGRIVDESASEVYAFRADDLRFVLANRRARENLGYSYDELRELTPVDLKPEFTPASFEQLIAPLRQGTVPSVHFSTVHRRKDDTTYDIEVHLSLSMIESPPLFVANILDVTERHQLEEKLRRAQRMEAIGQLTGGIAHDFNNLLTVIIGNLELVEQQLEDAAAKNILRDAADAAELGATLTDRLLTFARMQKLVPTTVDLNRVLLGMSELLSRTLGEEIEVSIVLAPDLWAASVDTGQIENAVLNLAINARDAMNGSGRLTIDSVNAIIDGSNAQHETGLDPGEYVLISVSDTGCGMSAEMLDRVFEPFFTTKGIGHGTGLGLSMVYGFAKSSGGHVSIYSEEGTGTTVNLYLPRDLSGTEAAPYGEPTETPSVQSGATVLVVEDNERVRSLTVRRLETLGYRTNEAGDGRQALEVLQTNPNIDLVLSDVVMPGGYNGYKLRDEIVARHPDIKVLLTSGYSEAAVRREAGDGVDITFLRKPYKIDDLARVVAQALDASP